MASSEVILRVDEVDADLGSLLGAIEFSFSPQSEILRFRIPSGCSVTRASLDGRILSRVSDRIYAQELASRSDSSSVYFDESTSSNSLAIFAKILETRRDLLSLTEAAACKHTDDSDQFAVFLSSSPAAGQAGIRIRLSLEFSYTLASGEAFLDGLRFSRFFPIFLGELGSVNPAVRVAVTGQTRGSVLVPSEETCGDFREGVGFFLGFDLVEVEISDQFRIYVPNTCREELHNFLHNFPKIFNELGHCVTNYTGEAVACKLVFLPEIAAGRTCVWGDLVLLSADLFRGDATGFVRQTLEPLALALASSAVEQMVPRIKDLWLAEGLTRTLAGRMVDFRLGGNEWKFRFVQKRAKFHRGVERGDDEIPLVQINSENANDFFRLKAELVFDSLRQSQLGNEDFRAVLRTLVERRNSGSLVRALSTEDFFDLCEETVDRESERAARVRAFKFDYVECVGVPIVTLNLQFTETKHLVVKAFQRPLQPSALRVERRSALTSSQAGLCGCGEDPQCRTDSGFEGPAGLDDSDWRPARRVWEGPLDVSVYRAPYVPLAVTLELEGVASEGELRPTASSQLSCTVITARKHECVRTRTARSDELVHGYVAVEDERWMLAKVEVFQSQLMWSNQLQFSRDVEHELQACEALSHVKGSAWVLEVLVEVLKAANVYSYTVRAAAGRALCHIIAYNNDRDALKSLWGSYLAVEVKDKYLVRPQDVYVYCETLQALGRVCSRASEPESGGSGTARDIVTALNELLKVVKLGVSSKRVDETVLHACTEALVYAGATVFRDQPQVLSHPLSEALLALKSDVYGFPLQSRGHEASVAVLRALAATDPPSVRRNLAEFVFSLVQGRLDERRCHLAVLEKLVAVMVVMITSEHPMTSSHSVLFYLGALADRVITGNKPGALGLFTGVVNAAPVTQRTLFCLLKAWETLRRLVEEGRVDRKSFDSPGVCEKFWKTLMQLSSLREEHPEIWSAAREVYRLVYGLKVPKCVQGVAEKPSEEMVKQFQQFVLKGRTYKPPKEFVAAKSRIVIGGVSRKMEQ